MKKGQKIALDFMLSAYPTDESYENILDAVRNEENCILVWTHFENCSGDIVADYIEELAENILEAYNERDQQDVAEDFSPKTGKY